MLLAVLFGSFSVPALGRVPRRLSHEGRLLRADGTPEAGTVSLTFRIYDAPQGGTLLWTEPLAVALSRGGYYSVELGGVVPLPDVDGRELWLGITVAGEAEMQPRARLGTAAYALRAASAARADDASSVGGTSAAELLDRLDALEVSAGAFWLGFGTTGHMRAYDGFSFGRSFAQPPIVVATCTSTTTPAPWSCASSTARAPMPPCSPGALISRRQTASPGSPWSRACTRSTAG